MTKAETTGMVSDPGNPSFGQPLLIGKKVRVAEGSEERLGEVDRVDFSTGDLFVWFGEITEFGAMRVAPLVLCGACTLVEE